MMNTSGTDAYHPGSPKVAIVTAAVVFAIAVEKTQAGSTAILSMLTAIKIFHTAVWALMAGSIMALPITAMMRRFRWSAVLTGLIVVECAVLAFNGGRCPLTDLAARYTAERADNFDIYLPLWLARYNKTIFGALFIAGEAVLVGSFLRAKRSE
jgi:hypothetical protein